MALRNKLVGLAKLWQLEYGQRAASFDHWEIAFREPYMLKERKRDLLDDSLNDHQNREESVGIHVRRKFIKDSK